MEDPLDNRLPGDGNERDTVGGMHSVDVSAQPSTSGEAESIPVDTQKDDSNTDRTKPMTDDDAETLMCRVCRGDEGSLYYPCLCTGSIKYVHQECLMEWLKYSKKEVCELCNHKYSFQPIYRADMPKALPITEIVRGLGSQLRVFLRTWLVYTMVVIAWLGIVPLTAARIFNAVFAGSMQAMVYLPFTMFSVENIFSDIMKGSLLLCVFICAFISLLWLREQIVHGGPPEWLHLDGEEEEDLDEGEGEGEEGGDEDGEGEEGQGDGEMQPEGDLNADREDDALEMDMNLPAHEMIQREENEVFHRVFAEARERRRRQDEAGEGLPLRRRRDGHELGHIPNVNAAVALPAVAGNQGGDAGPAGGQNPQNPQQQEEWGNNWNGLGDELTWQRLLGLDGSLVFIEHVFWVISLNTLFTILFAFSPYKLGMFILGSTGLSIPYFPTVAAVLTGYLCITVLVYIAHVASAALRLRSLHRWLGIIYLVLKVFLLVIVEIGFFPVICGCWLDLCSLKMFGSAYSSRVAAFASAPAASVFLHWMIGMVYVFYSASFVILLREVLRPGVLWFMRNLNDPEFNPIQEMIELPVQRHLRRMGASMILFFAAIMLVVFVPLQLINRWLPGVLPYNMSLTAETPLSELSVELLILQVVLPALLEQTQARSLMKVAVKKWCEVVGAVLKLDNYLLTEDQLDADPPRAADPPGNQEAAVAAAVGGGLAAEHQALLLVRDNQRPLPYVRPSLFSLRIALLLLSLGITTVLVSFLAFVVPVSLGRYVIRTASGHNNVHELYTTATGFYIIWIVVRGAMMFAEWFPRGGRKVLAASLHLVKVGAKVLVVAMPVILLIPMLFGIAFQLVVLAPLRISYKQTPLIFIWQDWAMGVLHTKIAGAVIMMGPEWWMKAAFDRIYLDGLMRIRVGFIYRHVIIPVLLFMSLLISWPYLGARLAVTLLGVDREEAVVVVRMAYPTLLCTGCCLAFLYWQYERLKGLAQKIRNDKYLVGTQLVNYERDEEKKNEMEAQKRKEKERVEEPVVDEQMERMVEEIIAAE